MRDFLSDCRAVNSGATPRAALIMALTLPDICASLAAENGRSSGEKYAAWFDQYLGSTYTRPVGPEQELVTFLSGNDCYALRCALLHQGLDDTTTQRARDALTKFRFVQPHSPSMRVHRNLVGTALNLQVNILVEDVCVAGEQWLEDVQDEKLVQQRLAELVYVDDLTGDFRL